MRIYLDTAVLIYWIEDIAPWSEKISTILEQDEIVIVASDLSRLEVLIQPLRTNNESLLTAYQQCFDELLDEVVGLSRSVIDQATVLRANNRFSTPDAIHLAAAIDARCDLFLTNDRELATCTDIDVQIID